MTSRELVYKTLAMENTEDRAPRNKWNLPITEWEHPKTMAFLNEKYPDDFYNVYAPTREIAPTQGDPFRIGTFVDQWGCIFTNKQDGIVGEVKTPIVGDEEWSDTSRIHIPFEWLTFDIDEANRNCRENEHMFRLVGCPRPFEQLQFIRGTENLFMDLADPSSGFKSFLSKMHTFYCDFLEKWAKAEIDAIMFMDDWGSQRSLLINPEIWRGIFGPMYKDYIDIAKRAGKRTFMHSDGYTLDILPDLIGMGLDAFNTQIFCMGIDNLIPFKGKITFWGEIDRQNMLPYGTPGEVAAAVTEVYEKLWDNGGCIAQCEFGPGSQPENVIAVYETWDKLTANR